MARDPIKDLGGAVSHHFDQAVLRPVRKTLDATEAVGNEVQYWVDRGKKAADRLLKGEPPKRTTDIVLKPDPTHGGRSKVVKKR